MDKVCEGRDPMIITRKRNQTVVMLSLEHYESLEKTAYLFRSPANIRRLQVTIQSLEEGSGTERELIDPSEK